MADGTVMWCNATKGFGFIVPDDGTQDVFVDVSSIEGFAHRDLTDAQRVTFDAVSGPKGPRTTSVRPLESETARTGGPPGPLGGEDAWTKT
jgi:cold shock protein